MKSLDQSKGKIKTCQKDKSRMVILIIQEWQKKESLDLSKRQPNYIENNKIDNSYIDFSEKDKKKEPS